jgi:hypothetical protein
VEKLVKPRAERLIAHGKPAQYRTEKSKGLSGNILIEAMKPLLSEVDAYSVLAHMPAERDKDFFDLPLELRLEGILDLRDVYIPTAEFIDALALAMRAIRRSYKYRDPRDPRVMRFLYDLSETEEPSLLPRLDPSGGGANGIMLIGTTGVGKTSFVDRLVQYVGKEAIIHTTLNGLPCYWHQVVIFRIQAAETKTVAGIVAAITAQADAITGSRYKAQLRGKTNRGELLIICCQILSCLMAGILIVEDLQLLRSTGGSATEILDFLANVMETTGIPVASVSTFRVKRVVKANTAVGSKLTAGGTREFTPLPFSADFEYLVMTYWSLRVSHFENAMPEWLPKLAHRLTAGVRRFLRELFEYLLARMAQEGIEKMSQDFVRECAAESIGRYKNAISCLKRVKARDFLYDEEYLLYEDLFDSTIKQKPEPSRPSPETHRPQPENSTLPVVHTAPPAKNNLASKGNRGIGAKSLKNDESRGIPISADNTSILDKL